MSETSKKPRKKPSTTSKHPRTPVIDPFKAFTISDTSHLEELAGRQKCPKCEGSRKFFCYDCYIPLGPHPELVPKLQLPIKCDVIHHVTENTGKSTAIHAKILAPDDVTILEFPQELVDWNPEETVLLYPSDDAVDVKDLDFATVKRVVFVDCQWHNAKRILKDPRLMKLKAVRINNYETLFWRWQNVGNECLATIEAIYYFYREFITAQFNGEYTGQVDDLLYYFSFMYNLVQKSYQASGKEFRRIKGFVTKPNDQSEATSSDVQIPNEEEEQQK